MKNQSIKSNDNETQKEKTKAVLSSAQFVVNGKSVIKVPVMLPNGCIAYWKDSDA